MDKIEIVKNKLDKLVSDGVVSEWEFNNNCVNEVLIFVNDIDWLDFKNQTEDFLDLDDVYEMNAYVKNEYIVLALDVDEDFNL